jgi:hypothetical protein
MFRNKRKLPLWLILGTVLLVALTACTAALSGSAVVANMPFDEQQEDFDEIIDEILPDLVENDTETSVSEGRNDVELLTIDDRPDRLRQLTRNWNTNWNLHTVEYSELLSGGPPRDGIRSIDDPKFIDPDQASAWLADNEPVIFLELNGDARA